MKVLFNVVSPYQDNKSQYQVNNVGSGNGINKYRSNQMLVKNNLTFNGSGTSNFELLSKLYGITVETFPSHAKADFISAASNPFKKSIAINLLCHPDLFNINGMCKDAPKIINLPKNNNESKAINSVIDEMVKNYDALSKSSNFMGTYVANEIIKASINECNAKVAIKLLQNPKLFNVTAISRQASEIVALPKDNNESEVINCAIDKVVKDYNKKADLFSDDYWTAINYVYSHQANSSEFMNLNQAYLTLIKLRDLFNSDAIKTIMNPS